MGNRARREEDTISTIVLFFEFVGIRMEEVWCFKGSHESSWCDYPM